MTYARHYKFTDSGRYTSSTPPRRAYTPVECCRIKTIRIQCAIIIIIIIISIFPWIIIRYRVMVGCESRYDYDDYRRRTERKTSV